MSGIVSSQAMNFESKNLEIVKQIENLKIQEDQSQRDLESLKNHIENELESDIISEFIEKQTELSRKFNKTIEQNEKAIKDVLSVQKQFISTSKSEVIFDPFLQIQQILIQFSKWGCWFHPKVVNIVWNIQNCLITFGQNLNWDWDWIVEINILHETEVLQALNDDFWKCYISWIFGGYFITIVRPLSDDYIYIL